MEKSKQRLFEEKVISFFVSRIEDVRSFVKDTFKYYENDESAGMYIVLPDIVRYLTNCVNDKNYTKVEEFFNVYNEFYEKFAEEYHRVVNGDTMYNLNAVELFEIIEEFEEDDKKKIIPLMSEKLQKEYREIY